MDNPQVTREELAWLAGIWDGEGTISVRRQKKMNVFSPRCSMVNSNPAIVRRTCELLDAMGIRYYIREKDRGGFAGSHRQCWDVYVDTLTYAGRFLTQVGPFLVGKRDHADLLLRFISSRLTRRAAVQRNSDAPYSPEEKEWVAQLYDLNGNQRGTSETIREAALTGG